MSGYAFPTNLATEEIIQCLQDLQISMDAGQLTKPTYEQVKFCYEQAILALTAVSREELAQPKFELVSTFEHPELHDESVPVAHFYFQITKLVHICGFRDFSLNDLYKPDPVRFRRSLCALINFAKYRDEKLDMMDELEAKQAEQSLEAQMLADELEKRTAEIKRLKELRAARQAEVAPIDTETEGIATQIQQYVKIKDVLDKDVRSFKTQANQLTDQASEYKLTLTSLQNEISQLEDEIVQSPDKHRQAIAELINATEMQRAYYSRLCSQSNDYDRKLEMIGKFERELQRCVKLQEELETAVVKKKDVNMLVKDTREAIATVDRQYGEVEAAKQTARRQLGCLQEKLTRLEHQNQLKLDVAASKVEEQRKAREAIAAEQAAAEARAAEVELQVRGWRERTHEVVAAKDAKTRAVKEKYAMLRRAVADYNTRLDKVMSAPPPGAAQPDGQGPDMSCPDYDSFSGMGTGPMLSFGMEGLCLK